MKLLTWTCGKCGYQWIPRVEVPKQCPSCKRYMGKIPKQGKLDRESGREMP